MTVQTLIVRVHGEKSEYASGVIGGTEETTTGVHRLRAMAAAGDLKYPVIAVNDAITKWILIMYTAQDNLPSMESFALLASLLQETFVVSGYGHCGKGVAMGAGMGANVIITEVDPDWTQSRNGWVQSHENG